ncbi:MAG: hypothetical protein JO212_12750 [Acetobacteraceae bacterium]|nr:hypothetical protein [Acetobacteraceae bacterium]
MHYLARATDYDGTIADEGVVDTLTLAALERSRGADRRLILVTGRDLTDVQQVMQRAHLLLRAKNRCRTGSIGNAVAKSSQTAAAQATMLSEDTTADSYNKRKILV